MEESDGPKGPDNSVGKSTTPTAQYSCHVRGVELFSIIQLYYLIVYIVSTCITCITCTDWWVSSILKRAPIHPSISKLWWCEELCGKGGKHSSIQFPGVLKRSGPPGHCLHRLHKRLGKPWRELPKEIYSAEPQNQVCTSMKCGWEGIIHQGLVLSLPLPSRVPSISPVWLVKLIGTTSLSNEKINMMLSYHVLPSFIFIYLPSVNIPQLLRPSTLSPWAQGPWPSGPSPASPGSWLGPPGPLEPAQDIGVPQNCCCILYTFYHELKNIWVK